MFKPTHKLSSAGASGEQTRKIAQPVGREKRVIRKSTELSKAKEEERAAGKCTTPPGRNRKARKLKSLSRNNPK